MSDSDDMDMFIKEEPPIALKKPRVIMFPRRKPSVVARGRDIVYITPDKTTCTDCPCFPKESPYESNKKLNPCLLSPLTLYELCERIVNQQPVAAAFHWSERQVADWIASIGFPQYSAAMLDNRINGRRLLLLEDPSVLPKMNIRTFEHIKQVTKAVRRLYGVDVVVFARSTSLPARKLRHLMNLFQSRTGPGHGARTNWTRTDIMRAMGIINPKEFWPDHWDLVWYLKPDLPCTIFGAMYPKRPRLSEDVCQEYQVPRKYILLIDVPSKDQLIWKQHRQSSMILLPPKPLTIKRVRQPVPAKIARTYDEIMLERRKMPRKKFMPQRRVPKVKKPPCICVIESDSAIQKEGVKPEEDEMIKELG